MYSQLVLSRRKMALLHYYTTFKGSSTLDSYFFWGLLHSITLLNFTTNTPKSRIYSRLKPGIKINSICSTLCSAENCNYTIRSQIQSRLRIWVFATLINPLLLHLTLVNLSIRFSITTSSQLQRNLLS